MVIVDTHVHVGLKKYATVEELLKQMERSKVDKAVLVQYRAGLEPIGNTDNTYISECARKYPQRLAAVGIVDWTKDDATEKLEYWVKEKEIQGIRLDGMAVSPGPDKYVIWEKAAELGINISVYGKLDRLAEIAERFPSLNLHIEHNGMPSINGDSVLNLAKYSNVSVKFSVTGLREISNQPYPYKDTHSFLKLIYDRFGSKRIVWGSDYPPCQEHEGYDK
ncbi:MAG: amidohydrolase family protein, partial [Candidatus Bathyarchaeia archaeon]